MSGVLGGEKSFGLGARHPDQNFSIQLSGYPVIATAAAWKL